MRRDDDANVIRSSSLLFELKNTFRNTYFIKHVDTFEVIESLSYYGY